MTKNLYISATVKFRAIDGMKSIFVYCMLPRTQVPNLQNLRKIWFFSYVLSEKITFKSPSRRIRSPRLSKMFLKDVPYEISFQGVWLVSTIFIRRTAKGSMGYGNYPKGSNMRMVRMQNFTNY